VYVIFSTSVRNDTTVDIVRPPIEFSKQTKYESARPKARLNNAFNSGSLGNAVEGVVLLSLICCQISAHKQYEVFVSELLASLAA
jgi:hypothetical protein